MGSKKVVLDTNVFISALGWKGDSRDIFEGCIRGDLKLFLSTEIFDEIKRVLNYPKFKFSKSEIDEFLDLILETGCLVETEVRVDVVKDDPSDDKFFECALTAGADYIISRDPHILRIKQFEGIKIISPEVFREENKQLTKNTL